MHTVQFQILKFAATVNYDYYRVDPFSLLFFSIFNHKRPFIDIYFKYFRYLNDFNSFSYSSLMALPVDGADNV